MKRKRPSKGPRLPRKKHKSPLPEDNADLPKTPNAIIFARSRMFYARPARSLRGHVIFGLRKERIIPPLRFDVLDVLNRYSDNNDENHAKHILKYIFPRQFGLHNVFTHVTDRRETSHAFKDYTDRENEIAISPKNRDDKAYQRLGTRVLSLVSKMQKLHKLCSYHELINYYCSSTPEFFQEELEIPLHNEKEKSKELTQKEISILSARALDEGVPVTSQDCDIIRHHTPQYKVQSPAYGTQVRSLRSSVQLSKKLFRLPSLEAIIISHLFSKVTGVKKRV